MSFKLFYTFIISFFCISSLHGQNDSCTIYIYISPGGNFYGTYFPTHFSCPDTIKHVMSDTQYYLCYMRDCRGEMKFEAYSNDHVIIQGEYVNSLDTLKHCVVVDDGHDPDQPMVVKVEQYFEPLKDGVWKYYDDQGNLVKKEIWERGILIEEKK